jgi:hypothetical protein
MRRRVLEVLFLAGVGVIVLGVAGLAVIWFVGIH